MEIACPHCAEPETDDFGVLDVNTLYPQVPCDGCGRRFALFIKECYYCEAEHVHAWTTAPSMQRLDALACAACDRSGRPEPQHENEARGPFD